MKSQWWAYDDLRKLQLSKLSRLLSFSYQYVPFYRSVFQNLGALPGDIKSMDDLASFPIIDKAFVMNHHDDFIPRYDFPGTMNVSTSGSSSRILSFVWHPDYLHMKSAANYRFESWARKGWSGRFVKLGSPFYAPADAHLLFKRNRALNTWTINTADLGDASLDAMVKLLNTIGPAIVSGYPSIIHVLARHMINNGYTLEKDPAAILTTSEILHDDMRETIEKAFHTRLFDWYGMIEGCASAGQCEFGNYHMNMEYNFMEFIQQDGIARIVGTNLENLAFPLIRYDTGDVGTGAGYACPCGRGLPLMKLAGGRITNLIRTASGYKYFYPAYFNHIIRSNIKEYQIIQNSMESLDVFIVPGDRFSEDNLVRSDPIWPGSWVLKSRSISTWRTG